MNIRDLFIILVLMFMAVGYTIAHNKVVVVPLGGTEPTLDFFYGSITNQGIVKTGNISSASRSFTGGYTIDIGRVTTGCAGTASVGWQLPGGTFSSNSLAVVLVETSNIKVRTRSFSTDTFESRDNDFHITITCPKI